MKNQWQQIAEGLLNHFLPAKDKRELILEVHESRIAICRMCPHNSNNAKLNGYETIRKDEHCTICRCPLITKTKSLSTQCPDVPPRWDMVLPDQERIAVEKEIRNEEQNQNPQSS